MRPRVLLVTVLLLTTAAGTLPPSAAEPATAVVAAGKADYSITKDGPWPDCTAPGAFEVSWNAVSHQILVAGSGFGCVPIFSLISGCRSDDDGTIRCQRGTTIDITLTADGRLDYVWSDSTFHEEIRGQLVRSG